MNTNIVAKSLGVSPSTIKRWSKQLGLQLSKNELGHYIYTDQDVELLSNHQENIQLGNNIPSVDVKEKQSRIGVSRTVAPIEQDSMEILHNKIKLLESSLDSKADSVVTYQLLQHRREIEELENKLLLLSERIEKLESKREFKVPIDKPLVFDSTERKEKARKKNIISMFFGI